MLRRVGSLARKALTYLPYLWSSDNDAKLEVGVPVWSAFHKKNLIKIEGVQRRAARFIVRSDMDYKGRLASFSLLPLSLRREMLDIIFLFKCRRTSRA